MQKGAEIKRLSPDHYTKSKPILGTAKLKSSLDKVHFLILSSKDNKD